MKLFILHDFDLKYKCADCGCFSYALHLDIIVNKKKLCDDCILKNKRLTRKKYNHTYRSKLIVKETFKKCSHCDTIFSSVNRRYCSRLCRNKGMANTKLKNYKYF
ncbi:MAG: hypothetical protein WC656_01165 [Sulfurimonas sp.]|jgi:hypothetical protein